MRAAAVALRRVGRADAAAGERLGSWEEEAAFDLEAVVDEGFDVLERMGEIELGRTRLPARRPARDEAATAVGDRDCNLLSPLRWLIERARPDFIDDTGPRRQ